MNETKVPKDTSAYKKHYSDSKFWDKAKSVGKNVLKPAMLLYYVMKSSDVPFAIKTKIIGALGYFILPLDLVLTVHGIERDIVGHIPAQEFLVGRFNNGNGRRVDAAAGLIQNDFVHQLILFDPFFR